ncbi:MAG: ferrochelatase, partial [Anaerolineales bacterium]
MKYKGASTAVLVMAYGGPDKIEDVEPYLLDVRNHRETPDHLIEEVRDRYKLIGGRSPILERTQAQAEQLEHRLKALDARFQVFVGMRHWHPFLRQAVTEINAAGFNRVVGIVMAPHYSRMSVEAYYERLDEAIESEQVELEVSGIRSWNMAPGYLSCLESRIQQGLEQFPEDRRSEVNLIFTAHSLPESILRDGDPY